MTRSTLITAFLLTSPLGLTHADDFDMFAPSWRGGQYSAQVGWNWPAPGTPEAYTHPNVVVAVNGTIPAALINPTPAATFEELNTAWDWVANAGHPGLRCITGRPEFGARYFAMNFQRWDRGAGWEPTLFRVQLTFDGPEPVMGEPPGMGAPSLIRPDPHHTYFDMEINNWVWGAAGFVAPEGTVLREVRIDTILMPTPGAGALLLAGALASLRRRRS